eukprot:gene7877-1087_t
MLAKSEGIRDARDAIAGLLDVTELEEEAAPNTPEDSTPPAAELASPSPDTKSVAPTAAAHLPPAAQPAASGSAGEMTTPGSAGAGAPGAGVPASVAPFTLVSGASAGAVKQEPASQQSGSAVVGTLPKPSDPPPSRPMQTQNGQLAPPSVAQHMPWVQQASVLGHGQRGPPGGPKPPPQGQTPAIASSNPAGHGAAGSLQPGRGGPHSTPTQAMHPASAAHAPGAALIQRALQAAGAAAGAGGTAVAPGVRAAAAQASEALGQQNALGSSQQTSNAAPAAQPRPALRKAVQPRPGAAATAGVNGALHPQGFPPARSPSPATDGGIPSVPESRKRPYDALNPAPPAPSSATQPPVRTALDGATPAGPDLSKAPSPAPAAGYATAHPAAGTSPGHAMAQPSSHPATHPGHPATHTSVITSSTAIAGHAGSTTAHPLVASSAGHHKPPPSGPATTHAAVVTSTGRPEPSTTAQPGAQSAGHPATHASVVTSSTAGHAGNATAHPPTSHTSVVTSSTGIAGRAGNAPAHPPGHPATHPATLPYPTLVSSTAGHHKPPPPPGAQATTHGAVVTSYAGRAPGGGHPANVTSTGFHGTHAAAGPAGRATGQSAGLTVASHSVRSTSPVARTPSPALGALPSGLHTSAAHSHPSEGPSTAGHHHFSSARQASPAPPGETRPSIPTSAPSAAVEGSNGQSTQPRQLTVPEPQGEIIILDDDDD